MTDAGGGARSGRGVREARPDARPADAESAGPRVPSPGRGSTMEA